MVALRLGSTVINCADIELMTRFWSEALGLRAGPLTEGGSFRALGGEHVNLSLQVAKTPVTARDQMHLDLYTAEKQREVERLVALDATWCALLVILTRTTTCSAIPRATSSASASSPIARRNVRG